MPKLDISHWLHTNFDVHTNNRGVMSFDCPFCDDDGHHMTVSSTKNVYNCWKCEASGRYIDLVMKVESCSLIEAHKYIKEPPVRVANIHKPLFVPRIKIVKPQKEKIDMPNWFRPLSSTKSIKMMPILQYTKKRGMSNEQIKKYNFGWCDSDKDEHYKFRNRLVMPVENGYFQARTIKKNIKPKYLNPSIDIGNSLFNAQALLHYEEIEICEGIFSAIAIGNNAIATLGISIRESQAMRIVKSDVKKVTLSPDAGVAMKKNTINAADFFSGRGLKVEIRDYKDGDPDSSDDYEVKSYDFKYKLNAKIRGW